MGHLQSTPGRRLAAVGAFLALLLSAPTIAEAHGQGRGHARRSGICNADALHAALKTARPGDTVRMGACEVTGSFRVPSGVTLTGVNALVSTIRAPSDGVGVFVEPTAGAATLRNLRVESDGLAGVLVGGSTEARLENLFVEASRGVGIAVDRIDRLEMTRVFARGPVDRDNAASVREEATPAEIATHGIVVDGVGEAVLRWVRADGFAKFGALFVDSDVDWRRGGASDGVGAGVAVWGGQAHLERLSIQRIHAGIRPPESPPAGLALVAGVNASTRDVHVWRVQGWGVFHSDAGSVQHDRLRSAANEQAGVWYQDGDYLQVDRSALVGNGYAGVVAIDSDLLSMSETVVMHTKEVPLTGVGTAGDGVLTVSTDTDLFDVDLMLNERVGLLAWVSGVSPCLYPRDHITASGVNVLAVGDQLGALFQRGTEYALVERGVRRLGLARYNDTAFLADPPTLGIADGVSPCLLPQARTVAHGGIAALLGGQYLPPGNPNAGN